VAPVADRTMQLTTVAAEYCMKVLNKRWSVLLQFTTVNKQTSIFGISAGSTATVSRPMLDNVSLDTCHGSGTKAEGFIKADSIPFPSISNNNLACISRTIALTS
jgi:hypothetical protein